MERMTARNIAIISPMRQRFYALSGASSFAAGIIEKYSGTEPFPISGDALVFLNALDSRLSEEQAVRHDVAYTLRLLIIHRLLVDGRLTDPTVGKSYAAAVSRDIEHRIERLRMTDNNAYIRINEAKTFIESSADFDGELILTRLDNGDGSIYSFVDTQTVSERFFGLQSEGHAYSGIYEHTSSPELVYKKEVGADAPQPDDFLPPAVSNIVDGNVNTDIAEYTYNAESLTYNTENTEQNITDNLSATYVTNSADTTVTHKGDSTVNNVSESVTNTADTEYNYNSENLTYKTETNEQNITDNSSSTSVINSANTEVTHEGDSTVNNVSESVINTADTEYNYNSENLTYKTENNEQNYTDNSSATSVTNTANTEVTHEGDSVVNNVSESVVNTADAEYNYNSENLTYKTENTEQTITDNSSATSVTNTANIEVTHEGDSTVNNVSESVINTADTEYNYNSENLTYKTETSEQNIADNSSATSVTNTANTEVTHEGDSIVNNVSESVVNTADTEYNYNSENLTYKTENTEQNIADNSSATYVTNSADTTVTHEGDSTVNNVSESVVNTADTEYNYNSENLTYKTETNEQNIADNSSATYVTNSADTTVTHKGDSTVNNVSESVVNTADTEYNYNTENLTYKTENNEQNYTDNSSSTSVINSADTTVTHEGDSTVNKVSESVVNTADTEYNYNSENLTYKTETSEQNITDNSSATYVTNSADTTVTHKGDSTVNNVSESVVNTADTEHNYNAESLTYNTENTEQNISDNSSATYVTNSADTTVTHEGDSTVNNVSESVVNTADTEYNYNSENLTYKTETNEQNIADNSSATYVTNSADTTVTHKGDSVVNNVSESVVNTADTEYNYKSENLTYKTETNEQNYTDNSSATYVTNSADTTVTHEGDSTVNNVSESVVNTADTEYNYNSENLTYKTENTEQNIADNSSATSVTNTSNTEVTHEGDLTVNNVSESVVNTADTEYNYNSENLTYKTENTEQNIADNSSATYVTNSADTTVTHEGDLTVNNVLESVVNTADAEYNFNSENLTYNTENPNYKVEGVGNAERAGGLAELGLLIMNTFLSGGAEYMSGIGERYVHRLRPLAKAVQERPRNSNSLAAVSMLERLLDEGAELTPDERRIYDTAVTKVYLESHKHGETAPDKMLEKMSIAERTKALSLMIRSVTDQAQSGGTAHTSAKDRYMTERISSAIANVILAVNEKKSVTEAVGQRLITFVSGKNIGEVKAFVSDPKMQDELSAQLAELYFTAVGGEQRGILHRVIQTANMRGPMMKESAVLQSGLSLPSAKVRGVHNVGTFGIAPPETAIEPKRIETGGNNADSIIIDDERGTDAAPAAAVPTVHRAAYHLETVRELLERFTEQKSAQSGDVYNTSNNTLTAYTQPTYQTLIESMGLVPLSRNVINNLSISLLNNKYHPTSQSEDKVLPAPEMQMRQAGERVILNELLERFTEQKPAQSGDVYNTSNNTLTTHTRPTYQTLIESMGLVPPSRSILNNLSISLLNGKNHPTSQSEEKALPAPEMQMREAGERVILNELLERITEQKSAQSGDIYSTSNNTLTAYTRPTYQTLIESMGLVPLSRNVINNLSISLLNNKYHPTLQSEDKALPAPEMQMREAGERVILNELLERITEQKSAQSGDVYSTSNYTLTAYTRPTYQMLIESMGLVPLSRNVINNLSISLLNSKNHPTSQIEDKALPAPEMQMREAGERVILNELLERITEQKSAQSGDIYSTSNNTLTAYTRPTYQMLIESMGLVPLSRNVINNLSISLLNNKYHPTSQSEDKVLPAPEMQMRQAGERVILNELLERFTEQKPAQSGDVYNTSNNTLTTHTRPTYQTLIESMGLVPAAKNIIGRKSISILNGKTLTAPRTDEGRVDMIKPDAVHDTVTLHYREPAAANAHDISTAPPHQPTQAELERQFGNLIEGASAGLTPSFDMGTRGIGDAMAAIERTEEKVQQNTKMIEQLLEKQRVMETQTLRSSDMDSISEEMIRKLRSRLRFDRSRFSQ